METLQAINLVLGASDFFVVLAIDPDMIHRAIARQRGLSDDDEAGRAVRGELPAQDHPAAAGLPGRTADQRFGFVSAALQPDRAARVPARRRARDEPAAGTPPPAAGRRTLAVRVRPRRRRPAARPDRCARCRTPRTSSRRCTRRASSSRQPARAQAAGQRAPAREDPAAAPRRAADRRSSSASSWPGSCSAPPSPARSTTLLARAPPSRPTTTCVVDASATERLTRPTTSRRTARWRAPPGSRCWCATEPAATRRPPAAASDPAAPPAASPS